MSDLFGYLEKSESEREDRLAGSRAKLIAKQRVEQKFASYINKAVNEEERKARIQYLSEDIVKTVKAACKEHDYTNYREVVKEIVATLKSACDCGCKEGKECACEDCPNKKESATKTARYCERCGGSEEAHDRGDEDVCSNFTTEDDDYNSDSDKKESATKIAEPVAVDGYQQETVNLKGSDEGTDGHATGPETDHNQVPKGGLDPIDVKSVRHPLENQSVTDKPDYTDLRHDGPEVADPTDDALRHNVNADDPIQPEFNKGPHTDTWGGEGGQANPVTSSVESKWFV